MLAPTSAIIGKGLGDSVGFGSDNNELRVGDQIQTRDNDSRLKTSDGRRVLNRDVWTVTGSQEHGVVLARHVRNGRTVEITPDYVKTVSYTHLTLPTNREV